nr:MAG TPA: hypothetical protein [Caudoviricetes sp.]
MKSKKVEKIFIFFYEPCLLSITRHLKYATL